MFSNINMPPAQTVVSTAASIAASAMVIRSIARDLLPYGIQYYIFRSIQGVFKYFSSQLTLIIEEFDGLASNQIYRAAEIYLGAKISPSTEIFSVSLPDKETKMTISMARNQEIIDIFHGVQFKWRQISRQVESKLTEFTGQASKEQSEIRSFELIFHKKHKELVFDTYLPFILNESKRLKEEKKTLKLYTLNNEHMRSYSGLHVWHAVKLDHPATFDILAMELELKKTLMEDLDRFVKRKDYYRRVGKAWKRGYLLYGPPGTGKSSLIAAMANYLNFDIYDLELADVRANSELRKVLIATGNRSILVVEDIDCNLQLEDRQVALNAFGLNRASQVTLSGFLNFIDGLWSSCGDERIIVFTTNHKDKLDPALLRPGRMDMHVHMSYCTPCGFDTLAASYLGITHDDHPLFPEVKELLEKTLVTPAEVGEQLLKNENPDVALQGLIEFLHKKKRESDEIQS